MSDVSELLLVQRFDADRGWFDFEVEKRDDGSEVHYAAKRFGLLRDDVSTGMDQLPAERISFAHSLLVSRPIIWNCLHSKFPCLIGIDIALGGYMWVEWESAL